MASNQSNTGEQGASFENGAPRCDGARRKAKFRSQTKRVVGPIKAYFCADAWSKAHGCDEDNAGEAEVSPEKARREAAKEARRESRAEDLKKGIMQYVVKVPIEDEGAKSMLWDIGQSAISKSPLYSAVKAVVANESLQEIVTWVVKTRGFGHLLVELSEHEDLREFTEAAAANDGLFSLLAAVAADPTLLDILRATITAPGLADLLLEITRRSDLRALTESVASDAELFSAAAAVVADGSLQAIVRSASTVPGLAELLLEISRRDDLRKLTLALSANVPLSDAASELAKTRGALLGSLTAIIRAAIGIVATGGDPALVTSAVAVALHDPEAVVETAAVRQAGGMRAKITNWLLGTG
jgi:hypothetical protein